MNNEVLRQQEASIAPSHFDAVIMLGAFMQQSESGIWKMPTIIQDDPYKVVGGHSRAIAAQQLFKENCVDLFLVTGGTQYDGELAVSRAEILAGLMIRKYKIPQEVVMPIGRRGNTLGNVEDAYEFLVTHEEIIRTGSLAFLTNLWQISRALVFFDNHDFFSRNGVRITPLVVEDILIRRHRFYRQWAHDLYGSGEMKTRTAAELNGIADFYGDTYIPHKGEKIRDLYHQLSQESKENLPQ